MTNPTEAALRKLLTAMNFRAACLTGSDTAAFEHADAAMWRAHDEALAALSTPAPDPVGMGEAIEEIDEAFSDYVALGAFPDTDECCAKRRQYSERMFGLIERLAQGGQSCKRGDAEFQRMALAEGGQWKDCKFCGGFWYFGGHITACDFAQGYCPNITPPTNPERAGA